MAVTAPSLETRTNVTEAGLRKGTVLLVDDDDDVRTALVAAFGNHPYTILHAAAGAQAIEICRTHEGPIDGAIIDVSMPGLRGHELGAQLKRLRPQTKVVYISGYSENDLRESGDLASGDVFYPKPVSMMELLATLMESN